MILDNSEEFENHFALSGTSPSHTPRKSGQVMLKSWQIKLYIL